jgi:hypothetical protein
MASSSTPRVPEANGSTSTHPAPVHPFAHSKNLLTVIRSGVDVEEESQFYDEFLSEVGAQPILSMPHPNAIFLHD